MNICFYYSIDTFGKSTGAPGALGAPGAQNHEYGMGWDRLSGTGVATALKIIYWPTPFLTRPEASRLGGLFQ